MNSVSDDDDDNLIGYLDISFFAVGNFVVSFCSVLVVVCGFIVCRIES